MEAAVKKKVNVKSIEELEKYIAESDGNELEITLEAGVYYLEHSLQIYGKQNIKIIGKDGARLIGGKKLIGVSPVKDSVILDRFPEENRDKIYVADLRANGIGDGEVLTDSEHVIGLSVDGQAMHVSQYPKRSNYIYITDYVNYVDPEIDDGWGKKYGVKEDGIIFNDPHVRTWKSYDNLWVNGFWVYDWTTSRDKVTEIDPEKMLIKTKPGYSHAVHFRIGQRMYFYNILEEVNEPCSYYVDDAARKIYFMPPKGSVAEDVILTTLKSPVVAIAGSNNITFENLDIESSESDGIKSVNSDDVSILYCEVKNLHGNAMDLGGNRIAVRGCSVHDNGHGGISVSSGDTFELVPGNSLIAENHIYRIGRWQLCYAGGMSINGVANTVRNNLVHDLPHTALFFSGNDNIIEHNELYNLIQDTGDSGAIYSGRNYTARGNIVRENFIHHLGGVGIGAMGVYNDDCLSGTHMENNVFLSVSRACMLGGGRDLKVKGNLFVSCHPAIELDSRGEPDLAIWRGIMDDLSKDVENKLRKHPIHIERYPENQDILDFFDAEECLPHINPSAVIENNVFCDSDDFVLNMGGISAELSMKNNLDVEFKDFADPDSGNFDLAPTNLAVKRGFENIDVSKFGLCGARCRDKVADVYASFEPSTEKLLFKMVNRGTEKTEVKYTFSTDVPGLDLSAYEVVDVLAPGETKTVVLPTTKDLYELVPNGMYDLKRINGLYKVLAYCPYPGVRPAEFLSKKEIFKFGV